MVDCDLDQRLVGRVILLNHTQLDIAYATSMASQFMHSSHESHAEAIYGIPLYLKFTPSNGILFQNTSNMGSEKLTMILIGMDQLSIEGQIWECKISFTNLIGNFFFFLGR